MSRRVTTPGLALPTWGSATGPLFRGTPGEFKSPKMVPNLSRTYRAEMPSLSVSNGIAKCEIPAGLMAAANFTPEENAEHRDEPGACWLTW